MDNLHFVGISGSGMSALAQFHAMSGGTVTGSDRYFDQGRNGHVKEKLEALGITVAPQDGSGITEQTGAVVVSTAIEESNPEMARAKELNIPVLHRSEILARFVSENHTIAVSGTSGKSTVTAMVFEILEAAGRQPSVITGGALVMLEERGLIGNAFKGTGPLVIEADESDGSLVRYKGATGLILNMDKDHKDLDELKEIFSTFVENSEQVYINGERPELKELFPECPEMISASGTELMPDGCRFTVGGTALSLPVPGAHNVENALAAVTACTAGGLSVAECTEGLKNFKGVARRFQLIGEKNGITVIDDFAHNPAKIEAALQTVFLRCKRVLAVYQPHGFAPTRFLKDELIESIGSTLRRGDRLYMPEIYYAGGTAAKDISAADIAGPIADTGKKAVFIPDRNDIIPELAKEAKAGDVILVMGARDPGLPGYCRSILEALP